MEKSEITLPIYVLTRPRGDGVGEYYEGGPIDEDFFTINKKRAFKFRTKQAAERIAEIIGMRLLAINDFEMLRAYMDMEDF